MQCRIEQVATMLHIIIKVNTHKLLWHVASAHVVQSEAIISTASWHITMYALVVFEYVNDIILSNSFVVNSVGSDKELVSF